MARSPILTLSPDLDLDQATRQIEEARAAQIGGIERFGKDMDTRLQGIYGQLTGALQQGAKTTGQLYSGSQNQIRQAYEGGGASSAGASQQVQSRLSEMAQRLGLDPRALAEVSGRLGEQAAGHQFRNQTAMADRLSTQAALGAGMSAVSQFAVQAAEQAKAAGRDDLARRVASEIQRANTLAAATRTDFTSAKAAQAQRAAAAAEREAASAMKELVREQKAAAREAAREQRRAQSSGGKKWDPFDLFVAKEEWKEGRQAPDPRDVIWNDYMAQNFGPKATKYIEERLKGKREPGKLGFKGNADLLETYVRRMQSTKR